MNTIYFNKEQQVREYYEQNGIPYVDDAINNAKKEDILEYYEQFKAIDGCSVAYCLEGTHWSDLYMCILWRGTAMRVCDKYDEKTYDFQLCDTMDWQGLYSYNCYYSTKASFDKPKKIGKPTASKLDQWRDYLLNDRKEDLRLRDYTFAYMLAKIEEVCTSFPEARNIEWENGCWEFEKETNGIRYVICIENSGKIYENYQLSYDLMDYPISPAEKAVMLMANALQGVKKCANHNESTDIINMKTKEKVQKFMGGRPKY